MELQGKNAVITGGGRGIGAAVARELAERGATVLLTARSADQIADVAAVLEADGHTAHAVACDVTDPEQVKALAGAAADRIGRIDILVNNAGTASSARLGKLTLGEWHRIFDVNVTGTFLCSQAFLPAMVEAGWGRIVNVASIAGLTGAAYISAYSASKHAVIGFTRSLAAEVARTGVTVNAVCPGFVATEMTEASVANIVRQTGRSEEEARASLEKMSPQGRLFDAEEVSYLVACLVDPRARGVHGHALVLDGGALLK